MKVDKEPEKTLDFNPDKASKALEELIKVFQENRLTIGEILITYGNLGYSLGTSIAGFEGKGPSFDELQKLYYSSSGSRATQIGVALALQGFTITTWYEDWARLTIEQKT